MAITTRQTSLLVQQDWTKIYQTFREANFQSFDFETIRKGMIDYLRAYYPEDFNDFTESSEYIALIDLIAFLGQSLAFRADLNARENFLDTAERRDSILKLAKLISYNPKRNIPAAGYLKFDSVSTSELVYDSQGTSLSNRVVNWNDGTNANWLEQFTTVLNASLVSTQAIGKPGASQALNGITTDEYAIKMLNNIVPVSAFTATVGGVKYPFEVVSATSANESYVYEPSPSPKGTFNFLYRNDNQGNSSNNTGYFFYFKQGTLASLDFSIAESLPNRLVSLNFDNVNNKDVWLYAVDTTGIASNEWTQVQAVNGINVIYNNDSTNKNLFSVATRANDQIDLVFGDGSFTNIPVGNFRVYYRTSNNITYKITPDEMSTVVIAIPYRGRTGRAETLTVRCSLKYTVTNAQARETLESIRTRAPQQYYTQNRMINGEDYNILPYTTFNDILKIKAVNRSSSGISRYLDVVDATGKYSKTNIFAEDGIIYKEPVTTTKTFQFTSSVEVNYIVQNVIKPLISTIPSKHLYYDTTTYFTKSGTWTQTALVSGQSTGYFTLTSYAYLAVGALVKFTAPAGQYFDAQHQLQTGTPSNEYQHTTLWASVVSAPVTIGSSSSVTLSISVPTGAEVSEVIPVFSSDWPASLTTSIVNNILSYKTFGLRYDITTQTWAIIDEINLNADAADLSLTHAGDTSGTGLDASWFIKLEFMNQSYTVTTRGLNYVFQSVLETRFYYDPLIKVYDSHTATTRTDAIKILRLNTQPDSSDSIFYSQNYRVWDQPVESDGYIDNRKILITFPDDNIDSVPDDPTFFDTFVAPEVNTNTKFIFFKRVVDQYNFIRYDPIDNNSVVASYSTKTAILNQITLYPAGTIFYAYSEDVAGGTPFYQSTGTALTTLSNLDYYARIGRREVLFQYTHNAPNNRRIDPSPNNLIDFYILTKAYSDQYFAYIQDSSNVLIEPEPPTNEDLKIAYGTIEDYKAISDSIVYNTAIFKPLFGNKAAPALQATFKVVKNPNINISDNDVKSQVIAAINQYFDINNWDFGETFYFSELSAYLHTTLTPNVSSIIIVPNAKTSSFGTLFQINAEPNEIVTSAATVDNVQVISAITAGQINQQIG